MDSFIFEYILQEIYTSWNISKNCAAIYREQCSYRSVYCNTGDPCIRITLFNSSKIIPARTQNVVNMSVTTLAWLITEKAIPL